VTALDVGAGAAVHVRSGSAEWLFDCGSDRNYQRVVRQYLHWVGVNRLDGLLLTHGDSLHIGGAAELLRDFPRVRLIDNPAPDRSAVHQQLQHLFQQRGIKPDNLLQETLFRLAREVTAHVLFRLACFSQTYPTTRRMRSSCRRAINIDSAYVR
jgi:beta-lactamase superfamily II metal-dependent hydrolase